jgi:hypothetical protein
MDFAINVRFDSGPGVQKLAQRIEEALKGLGGDNVQVCLLNDDDESTARTLIQLIPRPDSPSPESRVALGALYILPVRKGPRHIHPLDGDLGDWDLDDKRWRAADGSLNTPWSQQACGLCGCPRKVHSFRAPHPKPRGANTAACPGFSAANKETL